MSEIKKNKDIKSLRVLKRVSQLRLNLAAYDLDRDHNERINNQYCRYCFYIAQGRVTLHAFKEWSCTICNKKQVHPNYNTPVVCNECSFEHEMCVNCGADYELLLHNAKESDEVIRGSTKIVITAELEKIINNRKTKASVCKALNMSKQKLESILSGDEDFSIDTLSSIAYVLGKRVNPSIFVPL